MSYALDGSVDHCTGRFATAIKLSRYYCWSFGEKFFAVFAIRRCTWWIWLVSNDSYIQLYIVVDKYKVALI